MFHLIHLTTTRAHTYQVPLYHPGWWKRRAAMRGSLRIISRSRSARDCYPSKSHCARHVCPNDTAFLSISTDDRRPSNVSHMRRIYSVLPNVVVSPLYFAPEDINADRLLAMMKVDADSRKMVVRHVHSS
jgi:hypothetical protein